MSHILWFLFGVTIASGVAFIIHILNKRRLMKRAGQLTEYLEAVNSGKEKVLIHSEDELSHLEDELCKTVSELRIARDESQKSRKQQADNLADIAHQLKTPITSLSLMAQILADSTEETRKDCLIRIENQLVRLERLISSLLTMSKLDTRTVAFVREPTNFDELIACAIEPIETFIESRNQNLIVRGDDVVVHCDCTWTAEALLNIIKNCVEHTQDGGEIMASCSETPLYVEIVIEDNGKGFEPDEIPRLFRRFYSGKNAAKDSIGIGLALARSIIEGQNGLIRAENRQEGGARFVIKFYLK